MSEDEQLSDLDRRSLRILARSAKSSGTSDRLSTRLERAAETGARVDYEKAESAFDNLEPEQRRKIGTTAERQAETERQLSVKRRKRAPVPPKAAPSDDGMEWTAMFKPAPEEPDSRPFPDDGDEPGAEDADASMKWKLGRIPGNPDLPKAGKKAPEPPAIKIDPAAADNLDDEGKDWDWQRIPEDPVMGGGKKKKRLDPIEQLRQEMLGLDAHTKKQR